MNKTFLLLIYFNILLPIEYRYISRILPYPLYIHILEVNPKDYKIELKRSNNIETLSEIAKKYNALAAINGGFFIMYGQYAGQPLLAFKTDNLLYSMPLVENSAIGWTKGCKAKINNISTKWYLKIADTAYPIAKINKQRSLYTATLYNHALTTTLTSHNGTEIVISNNKVSDIKYAQGNTFIPENGYVYSVGKYANIDISKIKIGMKSEVSCVFVEDYWNTMDYILGGTPILIQDGETCTPLSLLYDELEGTHGSKNFTYKPHPRTAIGLLPNGNWLFVLVDGRQIRSWGITIPELAKLMESLGCIEAINIDGGGSTELYFKDKIYNTPSGNSFFSRSEERPISNAIIISKR